MKVEHVILADSAQVADGKLYVLGGLFGLLRCASLPIEHPMAFAVSLLLEPQDVGGQYPVTLELRDDTGSLVIPAATIRVAVGVPEVQLPDNRALFALNVRVPIQKAGRYTLTVATSGSTDSASFSAILVGQAVELLTDSPQAVPPVLGPPSAVRRYRKRRR
jgi:hypothetical protein